MTTKQKSESTPWWQPKTQPAALSKEQQQLINELALYDGRYHPEMPCSNCGCPLSYSLKLDPTCVLCCRCFPGGHKYGFERHARLLVLFPKSQPHW